MSLKLTLQLFLRPFIWKTSKHCVRNALMLKGGYALPRRVVSSLCRGNSKTEQIR